MRAGSMASRPRNAWLISRQRIVGNTNGSSIYVLSIMAYLKSLGYRVHYRSPSPLTLGRWAVARLLPETSVFDTYAIRGTIRLGTYICRLDPAAYVRAALAVADRLVGGLGLRVRLSRPPPHAMAVSSNSADRAFLRQMICRPGDVVLLDYAFLTPSIADLGGERVPSIVIMHDLISSRAAQFGGLDRADGFPSISLDDEMALLGRADLVLAIQHDEAAIVRANLPDQAVAAAPMAVNIADEPHPGEDQSVLFVGSLAEPNADGLFWFLETVWPALRGRHPNASLDVVGSVCQRLAVVPPGVVLHGVVPHLDDFYRRAGIVISPLRVGSGLKIKLIEALGWGKAVVATPVTLQGVAAQVGDAVAIATDAREFITALDRLIADRAARTGLARKALDCAYRHFRVEACYRPIAEFLATYPAVQA